MVAPAITWRELRQISRNIGAFLTIVGGVVLFVEALFLADVLPPRDGYVPVQATVRDKEQVGTFQTPAFLVTLAYELPEQTQNPDVRSGRRVAYEIYRSVEIGDELMIFYNPNDPFEWRTTSRVEGNRSSDYVLSVVMIIFGFFSWLFPTIVRLASREDDFMQGE